MTSGTTTSNQLSDDRGFTRSLRQLLAGDLDRAQVDSLMRSLVAEAATGSGVALDRLATTIYVLPIVRDTINRVLFDDDDAEEALQETVLAVIGAVEGFRAQSTVITWLKSIARYKALDVLAAKQRRHQGETTPDSASPLRAEAFSSLLATRVDLDSLLTSLPPPLAEVVRLRDVEQLSYHDIAVTLDLNLNTVKSRLARGRARLAPLLNRARP